MKAGSQDARARPLGTALIPSGLPPDEAALVPNRLRWCAIIASVVFALLLATEPLRPAEASMGLPGIIASALGMALSIAVTYLAPRVRMSTQAFTDLALAFEIGVGLALWVGELAPPMANTPHMPGIPTVAAWVILFPQIVPLTTRASVLGAAALVLGGPVVLVCYIAGGQPAPSWDAAFVWTLPMIVSGIGSVAAHAMVRRAVQGLRTARERDHYELLERLAQGGMGELYVARHHRLARLAAVKRIRPDLAPTRDPASLLEMQRRFELEARTIARLRSPHTVELFDAGVTEDGALYYAMELLDGVDLQDLVERFGPLPPARVVHLLLQACDSLAEAHTFELVHRDIKPSNLMVCRVALKQDVLKVVDFGLVALSATHQAERLTKAGMYLGTPAYSAPELIQGAAEPRSDLYALGCVAWWMLTGATVFGEDADVVDTLTAHREAPPPRLQDAVPLAIPDALADLVHACLAKRPADRPDTAQTLARRLRAIPMPPWTDDDADTWWARHADDLSTPVMRSMSTERDDTSTVAFDR